VLLNHKNKNEYGVANFADHANNEHEKCFNNLLYTSPQTVSISWFGIGACKIFSAAFIWYTLEICTFNIMLVLYFIFRS